MALHTILVAARNGHRALYLFAVSMAGLSVVLGIAALVDHRTVLGSPLWFKPLKFAVSFVLYAGSLSWLMSRMRRVPRAVSVAARTIVIASSVEMLIITVQAARGERSHFNLTTGLNSALFSVMGVTIALLYIAAIVIAVAVLRERGPDRVVTTAVQAGLLLSGNALAL